MGGAGGGGGGFFLPLNGDRHSARSNARRSPFAKAPLRVGAYLPKSSRFFPLSLSLSLSSVVVVVVGVGVVVFSVCMSAGAI